MAVLSAQGGGSALPGAAREAGPPYWRQPRRPRAALGRATGEGCKPWAAHPAHPAMCGRYPRAHGTTAAAPPRCACNGARDRPGLARSRSANGLMGRPRQSRDARPHRWLPPNRHTPWTRPGPGQATPAGMRSPTRITPRRTSRPRNLPSRPCAGHITDKRSPAFRPRATPGKSAYRTSKPTRSQPSWRSRCGLIRCWRS
mmetsp:Transcript_79299/g.229360  ORF Transcript_79299/g.229360 Transcript_79299/m.229360 type:complete len:200 (+) Transcript_79299:626-1225(+)